MISFDTDGWVLTTTGSDLHTENGYQTDNSRKKVSAIPTEDNCNHRSDLREGKPAKVNDSRYVYGLCGLYRSNKTCLPLALMSKNKK